MSFRRYVLIVVASVAGTLGFAVPVLSDAAGRSAAVLGGALAAANAIAAYGLVVWAAPRSNLTFFRAVLGGTLGRMASLFAAVLVAVLVLEVPQRPFVVSLLAYFVALLAFELAVVHRRGEARP